MPRVRILLVREHLEHALDDIVCHVERQARGHTADALRRRPAHDGVAVAQPAEELLDDLLDGLGHLGLLFFTLLLVVHCHVRGRRGSSSGRGGVGAGRGRQLQILLE